MISKRLRGCVATVSLLVVIVAPACAIYPSVTRAQDDFIRTNGTQFQLHGAEFNVAGINNHYLTFGSDEEVTRVLDDAVLMGANVVRTFLQPVIGSPDGSARTVWNFQSGEESSALGVHGRFMLYWDAKRRSMAINDGEKGIGRLDYIVEQASRRGLRLILCFADFWGYTGGALQMSAWYGHDDANPFFFTDERTKEDYRRWVRYVIERINPRTGRQYRNDPWIFAWELMNEPYAEPDALRNDWIAEMSAYVKSLDPNHLVASGHANVENRLSDIGIATIDFSTWHGYPLYYRLNVEQFDGKIREFCAIGRELGKPVLLEEFGYARSNADQIQAYEKWLDTLKNEKCGGWIVWRLVAKQDSGRFPIDDYDQFDVRNDGGELWRVLRKAAQELRGGSPN